MLTILSRNVALCNEGYDDKLCDHKSSKISTIIVATGYL